MNNPSSAQLMYLRQCRRHQLKIKIFRFLILVVFLLQWELCARYGKIDPFIFSSPTRLIICFYQMITGQKLLYHIGITLFETLSSFFFVIILTLLIAAILWFSKTLSETLEPYLVVLNLSLIHIWQDYCGCVFSKREREEQKRERAAQESIPYFS